MMMSELVEAQRGTLLNTTDRVLGSAVSMQSFCPPLPVSANDSVSKGL